MRLKESGLETELTMNSSAEQEVCWGNLSQSTGLMILLHRNSAMIDTRLLITEN